MGHWIGVEEVSDKWTLGEVAGLSLQYLDVEHQRKRAPDAVGKREGWEQESLWMEASPGRCY